MPQPHDIKPNPTPEAQPKPQDVANQVPDEAKVPVHDAHAHPISHPEECSHALARIGLVADGVGPKKLKTGENHQPGPATELSLIHI